MDFSSMILGGDDPNPEVGRAQRMAEPPELQTLSLSDRLAPSNDDDDDDDDDDEEDDAPAHWTFLEILDLLRQYAVPSIDLWARVGTVEDVENTAKKSLKAASAEETTLSGTARHYSHALGGGYSAIVLQHTTIEDVLETITDDDVLMRREPNLVTRAGTVVAFKKISPRPPGNSESQSSSISEAFRTICQEIGVCRHPLLRNHENIGKILYVAWERLETFPWLALELAAFGTLEDVLTAPGEGPTLKQKLNLTIDIAVGLAALHKAGIVHGDLKPANILVQKHAERQIVGQLSDFGGSASLKRGAPSIGTPLWLAPEACTACQSISWMPADTWSFGLVVASIWCHEPHRERTPSSCYLENLIPKLPDTKATDARILLIKTEHDLSPDSIVSRCITDFAPGVAALLLLTLSSQSTKRLAMKTIVAQHLDSMCATSNRQVSLDYSHEPVPNRLPFKVWSAGYRGRTKAYHEIVYHHLEEACNPLKVAMELQENILSAILERLARLYIEEGADQPPIWSTSAFLAIKLSIDNSALYRRQAVIALQVAMSHCCQLGIETNDSEFVTWAYTAAKGGHHNALWMSPLLENSSVSTYGDPAFRKACLVIGSCIGSMPSLTALEQEDYTLYEMVRSAIRSRQRLDFTNQSTSQFFFFEFLNAPRLDPLACNLIEALRSQNSDRVRELLGDPSTEVADMVDEAGRNVLHLLTYLEDKDTEDLALLAYVHGANLHKTASLDTLTAVWLYRQPIVGTPIYWAAMKGMSCLFKQLLDLHEETSSIINNAYAMTLRVALLHHHDILRILLNCLKENPGLISEDTIFSDQQELLQMVLGVTLTPADITPVSRRLLHGSNHLAAKLQTIQVSLDAGAQPIDLPCFGFEDFIESSQGRDAVSLAIVNDDKDSLKLLLAKLRDILDETQVLGMVWSYLIKCIHAQSLKCLRSLLEMFPEAANPSSIDSGQDDLPTPLNIAARMARPEYALALLENGANVSVRHMGFSPLARALGDGHVKTAEIIYSFCSDRERQRTFGYNDKTGFSMSGRLMSIWRTSRKGKGLVDSMEWLHKKGGVYFDCEVTAGHPVWTEILFRRASSLAEQHRFDNLMLATLFRMFPEKLHEPDKLGLFPIHRAAMNGHRYAIELLLDHGINIDSETAGSERVPKGLTPLTIANQRLVSDPPPDISAGGRVEIRRWRETMTDIQRMLLNRGATIGNKPSSVDFYRNLQYTIPGVQCITRNQRDQDDEAGWGEDVWPKKLPKDETSKRANQQDGGELMTAQTKNMFFLLFGPLTRRSEDISDENKEEFSRYKEWLLRKATARAEDYTRHSLTWNTVHNDRTDQADSLPAVWQQWHSCFLKRMRRSRDVASARTDDAGPSSHRERTDLGDQSRSAGQPATRASGTEQQQLPEDTAIGVSVRDSTARSRVLKDSLNISQCGPL